MCPACGTQSAVMQRAEIIHLTDKPDKAEITYKCQLKPHPLFSYTFELEKLPSSEKNFCEHIGIIPTELPEFKPAPGTNGFF
jgi:hypothetical protein